MLHFSDTSKKKSSNIDLSFWVLKISTFHRVNQSTLSIRSECPYHHGEHIKKGNSGENVTVKI